MRLASTSVAILAMAASAAAQATRWVGPSGNDANPGTFAQPFRTINHANAVSSAGDIVRLQAGVYGDEQGIIVLGDRDIAVVGAGAGATIVRAHSSLTTNVPTGFPNAPVASQQRPVILVQGTATVDLRAFTVDGNFSLPANGRLTGVYYRGGADGVVSDLEIRNCEAAPLDGNQGPAGVVVRGDNALDTCRVTLHNVLAHRWGKVGMAAFFNAVVTVEDCQVVGADHVQAGGAAQNGIQIGYDAEALIRRTKVADIYYDPANFVAAGVLAYDAGDVTVEDCAIANCENAIYYYGANNTTNAGQIRRNHVVACDAGVYLDDVSGLTVADNHLQLSLDQYANAGFSNVPGNTWQGNCYSSYSGVGPHAIPGGGGAVDATPRRGVDLFDGQVTTALNPGHVARQLVVAQLDGNVGSDFATVDENSGLSVTIGKNLGGSFSLTNLPFAASGRAIGIVAAELNGAPGLDLAVLLQVVTPTPGARVYTFANNGTGTFSLLGSQFVANTLPSAIAAGDVNSDGLADLAIANVGSFGGGDAIVLYNTGFGASFTTGLVPGFGFYSAAVRGVALSDVTGDGKLDLLVTEGNQFFGRLHVFAGNGLGNFAATGYSPLYVANDPTAVAAGDLDGDGDSDILVTVGSAANSTPGAVALLENLGSGFWRRSNYNADYSANAVAIGNVDNDSDPDSTFGDAAIVNTDGGTISVLGAYVQGSGFSHGGIAVTGSQPTAVAFGNFDGDAYQDLFYTNGILGQVVVLRGRPSARTDYYGFATEGYRARVPHVGPVGLPGVATQPNATLGIEVTNGRSFTLAAIVCSLAPAPVLMPNDLQINLAATLLTYFAVTDIDGRFTMPFSLPGTPSIRGMELYFQAGVLDTIGNYVFFPGVSLSQGMKLRVGY